MATNEKVDDDLMSTDNNVPTKGHLATGPSQSNKPSNSFRRPGKRRSPFWDHFRSAGDPNDPNGYTCIYCGRLVHPCGTSVLINHLDRCKGYLPNIDKKRKLMQLKTTVCDDDGIEPTSELESGSFDQEVMRKALAKMIIIDGLSFKFVEGEGFRHFCEVACPHFILPSWITVAKDCIGIFIEERTKLKDCFRNLSSRACLTIDTWTSSQDMSYLCLTAHFIDDDWKLQKKIINFCLIAGHSGKFIGRAVEQCLVEWGLKSILTITVDNASTDDGAVHYLGEKMKHWGGSVLDNKFLSMRCAGNILNLAVKDALDEADTSIIKVRNFVKFIWATPARLQSFKVCAQEEQIKGKGFVFLDVDTRWNSTYLMLASAVKFRKAFDSLYSKSNACKEELRNSGGAPEQADWEKVSSLLPFLKIFYDATLRLSGSCYVTGNNYAPVIYGIRHAISDYCQSRDGAIQDIALQMKMKYDKYWGNVENLNVLLFVALVLDPRRKWAFTEWTVQSAYEEPGAELLICKIKDTLKSLFDFYASSWPEESSSKQQESSSSSSAPSSPLFSHGTASGNKNEQLMDAQCLFLSKFKKEMGISSRKSELDKYLAEDCESDDEGFDVLQWWKDQRKRYPILAAIARDVLAIPVSTVASESAFSTTDRVLDSFRTSLTPRIVEALVCAQSWLRTSTSPIMTDDILSDLEIMEEDMKDLPLEQHVIAVEESLVTPSDGL